MSNLLITGSSSGFGFGVALAMAQQGWNVFATLRNQDKALELKKQAAGLELEGNIEFLLMDVTDQQSVDTAVSQVLEQTGGKLDALLNNAGYSIMGAFEDLPMEEVARQMDTNFYGVLRVTKAVLPAMRNAGAGRILTVTSNAVNSPHPFLSIYAASKWALEGWAEGLAMELEPYGIDVGVVQPGAHRTDFANNVQAMMPESSPYSEWAEAAFPGIANLDKWGRDAALGVDDIVSRLISEHFPFRTQSGEDAKLFARLKGAFDYELRAFVLRSIVGLPSRNEFRKNQGLTPSEMSESGRELFEVLLANMARRDGKDLPFGRELLDLVNGL